MSVWCFTDLHGNYNIWQQIKECINSHRDITKVYCLGDCIDRGPDGYQILKEVLNHKKITFLIGNHEEFFINNVPKFIADNYSEYDLWCEYNGGEPTWEAVLNDTVAEVHSVIAGLKYASATTRIIYKRADGKKMYLSHSGYNPFVKDEDFKLRGKRVRDRYIWDRDHISTPYDDETFANYHGDFDWKNSYIVHGHTPVQYITNKWKDNSEDYNPKVLYYANNHKIDLDLCTIESNKAVLFNLDTFEEVYFECKNE